MCSEFKFCKTFRFHTYHTRTLMLESVWISITGTVSRLFAGWLGNCCSLSGRARDFSLVQSNQTSCGTHPTSKSVGNPTSWKGLGHETGHTPPSIAKVRNVWSCTAIASYTQREVLLALARKFMVGVTENGSMILLFVNKCQVCALPEMMLLNLDFILWMDNGPAVFESSVWYLVANRVLCS